MGNGERLCELGPHQWVKDAAEVTAPPSSSPDDHEFD